MLAAGVLLVGLAFALGFETAPSDRATPRAPEATWPDPDAPFGLPPLEPPATFGQRRIYLDPGHGAKGNTGNRSCLCEDEQDFTLRTARRLARRLEAMGSFEVRVSRSAAERVEYPERVQEAIAWQAEVFVSLHSDVRGHADLPVPAASDRCPQTYEAPGFSVLWSDEAAEPLRSGRQRLAQAVARQLERAGFIPYHGGDYHTYAADPHQAGVFVDRHQLAQRIYVLRRPTMPSVIIETHNALHPGEAQRWEEPRTLDVFAQALAAALYEVLGS